MKIWSVILSVLLLTLTPPARSKTETLTLHHKNIASPLHFTVYLPDDSGAQGTSEYNLLFDYHPLAGRYLEGVHFWLRHNGNAPWPATIIVTPQPGNPSGNLFAPESNATPLADFIANDLLTALEKQYALTGFRMFNGFRHNGTLGLSLLMHHPEAFQAYFISCPELTDNFNNVLSDTREKAGLLPPFRYLYLSCGENVKTSHTLGDIAAFRALIQKHPQVNTHFADFSEHSFMSYPLRTVMNGIEWVFYEANNGLKGDSQASRGGVEAIIDAVSQLSEKKYGFTVSPFLSLQNRGNWLLANNQTNDAITFFTSVAARYPEDAYSWYNLARAQQQAGQTEAAITSQQRAVRLATENRRTWHQKKMQAFLDSLTLP